MVAAALVGLVMGGLQLKRRRDYFLSQAEFHASTEDLGKQIKDALDVHLEFCTTHAEYRDEIPRLLKDIRQAGQEMDYYATLHHRYLNAASYPWLTAEPDPPEPERTPFGRKR
jgi:hypothetical protein